MSKIKITKQFDKYKEVLNKLNALNGEGVEVGFFDEQGSHTSGYTFPELAVIHESGQGVTKRSFMDMILGVNITGGDKSPIGQKAKMSMMDYLRLDSKTTAEAALNKIGEEYLSHVDDVMGTERLPVTTNPTPLIDTRELNEHFAYRNTISKEIKEKG